MKEQYYGTVIGTNKSMELRNRNVYEFRENTNKVLSILIHLVFWAIMTGIGGYFVSMIF